MKRAYIPVILLLLAGLQSSCLKKYDLKKDIVTIPLYDFECTAFSGDEYQNNCVSLDWYVYPAFEVSSTPDRDYKASFDQIDFIYDGMLMTPASKEAEYIRYQYEEQYEPGSWPIRNNGNMVVTTLQKSDFDTLRYIEAIRPLTLTAASSSVDIGPGNVVAFDVKRGYGLIYVESGDYTFAKLHIKFTRK